MSKRDVIGSHQAALIAHRLGEKAAKGMPALSSKQQAAVATKPGRHTARKN